MMTDDSFPTPALLLDRDALDRNIERMARWAEGRVAVRPHVKTCKSVEIARRQVAAGAIGVTAATSTEAIAMLRGGIPEVLVANQLIDPLRLAAVLAVAAETATTTTTTTTTTTIDSGRLILAVDTPQGVVLTAEAAASAGIVVDVVIEIDVGMARGGVRSTEEALELAALVDATPTLRLVGVAGYEGHTVLVADDELRELGARQAMDGLAVTVAALRDAGHRVDIVSCGGTNTHLFTGPHPIVTELQVGTYVALDTSYAPFAPGYEQALWVRATVVSAHGSRVVLDSGTKALGPVTLALPRVDDPRLSTVGLAEEHLLADLVPGATAPAIGDRVDVVVGYVGGAVRANDEYLVVSGGSIVDRWPIIR